MRVEISSSKRQVVAEIDKKLAVLLAEFQNLKNADDRRKAASSLLAFVHETDSNAKKFAQGYANFKRHAKSDEGKAK